MDLLLKITILKRSKDLEEPVYSANMKVLFYSKRQTYVKIRNKVKRP